MNTCVKRNGRAARAYATDLDGVSTELGTFSAHSRRILGAFSAHSRRIHGSPHIISARLGAAWSDRMEMTGIHARVTTASVQQKIRPTCTSSRSVARGRRYCCGSRGTVRKGHGHSTKESRAQYKGAWPQYKRGVGKSLASACLIAHGAKGERISRQQPGSLQAVLVPHPMRITQK